MDVAKEGADEGGENFGVPISLKFMCHFNERWSHLGFDINGGDLKGKWSESLSPNAPMTARWEGTWVSARYQQVLR